MSNPKIVTIVQARMGSTRLPGKVLLPIGPLPAIIHTLKRCELAGYPVVCAIPEEYDGQGNRLTYDLRKAIIDHGFTPFVYDGDGYPDNVLGRYLACAREHQADIVVRVTGDCPFVQPEHIREIAEGLIARPRSEYASNAYRKKDRVISTGWDVEAFRLTALSMLAEHVTLGFRGMYHQESEDGCDTMQWPPVALDTPEDYAWFQRVAELIDVTPPHPTVEELLSLLETHPELKR